MFWLLAGTAVATGGWIVVVTGLLAVRNIAQRFDANDMISVCIGLVMVTVCLALPLVHIIQRLRGRAAPFAWRLAGWVTGPSAAILGALAVANDPGDSAWLGVLLVVFGLALSGLCMLHAKEFKP
jgi:hypothetical protein